MHVKSDGGDATDARSTKRNKIRLRGNHEEADTRLILERQSMEDTKRVLVICRNADVMLLLVHFISTKVAEMWIISGTENKWKCYPIHAVSERFMQPLKDNPLSFHALTGCDTTSSFNGSWKTFENQPLVVKGIGHDGELAPIEQFCQLYGTPEKPPINHARLQLSGMAKKGLEMLPPTRDALELHTAHVNYQAKI